MIRPSWSVAVIQIAHNQNAIELDTWPPQFQWPACVSSRVGFPIFWDWRIENLGLSHCLRKGPLSDGLLGILQLAISPLQTHPLLLGLQLRGCIKAVCVCGGGLMVRLSLHIYLSDRKLSRCFNNLNSANQTRSHSSNSEPLLLSFLK